MEILWTALGISVIVGFVFYVLAQHWQKLLRQQSGTIARLSERLRDIEDVADPEFLRRINEAAPSPLEQVFTFSFRLSDTFWNRALGIAAEDLRFIRAIGSVPASVKIERWRGHSVATITEVLPESKAAGWQTRSLDLYAESTKGGEAIILWEIPLARARHAAERPSSLELLFHSNSLELRGHLPPSVSGNGHAGKSGEDGAVFFRVPLDAPGLAEFQSYNAPQAGDHDKQNSGLQRMKRHGKPFTGMRMKARVSNGSFVFAICGRRPNGNDGRFWSPPPSLFWEARNRIASEIIQRQRACGFTGNPTHTFRRPRNSRTTERASRVFRHQ